MLAQNVETILGGVVVVGMRIFKRTFNWKNI